MNADFYTKNRKRLLEKLEDGAVVFLYSGQAPVKSHDEDMHPFAVNRNFYYLTGIDTQDVWLLLAKSGGACEEMLFIDQPDEERIKWNGPMLTCEEASAKSGIPVRSVYFKQNMDRMSGWYLNNVLNIAGGSPTAYFSFDRFTMSVPPTHAELYARRIRDMYPFVPIKNVATYIISLRSVKTPEEIELIRRAGDITIAALTQMLRTAKPGEYEYQWAADFEHYVARAGLRTAFTTIAASGPNTVMLHYMDNNCIAEPGGLFLFDLGAEYQYYSSDVSRTFPISGTFTQRQKDIYSIVREAMLVAQDKMRVGESMREPNRAVVSFYGKELRRIGLITDESEVERYYYHSVSHPMGLDTHDPCDRTIYEPGMVVSCEPGLYIAEEGIGIRLENDILITENGPEDLIGNRLLDISEIEAIMQSK